MALEFLLWKGRGPLWPRPKRATVPTIRNIQINAALSMRKYPKKTRRNLVRTSSILSLTASKSMARTTENRKQKTKMKSLSGPRAPLKIAEIAGHVIRTSWIFIFVAVTGGSATTRGDRRSVAWLGDARPRRWIILHPRVKKRFFWSHSRRRLPLDTSPYEVEVVLSTYNKRVT